MTDGREPVGGAAEIDSQAAMFLQRRKLMRWGIADQQELDAWLAQSTAHRVAYVRLSATEALVERVSDLDPGELRHLSPNRIGRFRFGYLAIAASFTLMAIGGAFVANQLLATPPDRSYATGVGELATLKFGDGTEIELNTNSAVRYRMTSAERTVELERGEAYFKVAHDGARPFTVAAAGRRITDLGTEFLVREEDLGLDVLLVKGRAALSGENPAASAAMLLPGDEAVATRRTIRIEKRSPQALADALSWRKGVVVFRNTSLAEVVREFNRYNERQLVVADNAIAGLKFSAELKTNDYRDFLELAQSVYGIRAEQRGPDIYLYGSAKKHKRSGR